MFYNIIIQKKWRSAISVRASYVFLGLMIDLFGFIKKRTK